MIRFCGLFLVLAVAGGLPPASARVIDADLTGSWYDPAQSGHGLQIEVIDQSRAVVTWYAFDTAGDPLWLIGIGDIQGDVLRADLTQHQGPAFPPDYDPEDLEDAAWGEIEFRLTGCDRAELAWHPVDEDFQAGELALQRLTRIDGQHCSEPYFEHERRFTPANSAAGFEAIFFDYPDGEGDAYELEAGFRSLPEPWDSRGGVMIRGTNRSDDLMMVLYRRLDGLEPATDYRVELEMQFATNVPDGCAGVGGSPGESVYVRLGAAGERPDYVIEDGYRRSSLDLGQQSRPGEDALEAGDMSNGGDESLCTEPDRPWRLKRVSTGGQDFTVTSDDEGHIWVYGLSDSGFEATTTWYLTEFVVRLAQADQSGSLGGEARVGRGHTRDGRRFIPDHI